MKGWLDIVLEWSIIKKKSEEKSGLFKPGKVDYSETHLSAEKQKNEAGAWIYEKNEH